MTARFWSLFPLCLLILLGEVQAQQSANSLDELRQKLDAQEAELRQLRTQVDAADRSLISSASFETLNMAETAADKPKDAPKAYEVGSDLKMTARWNPANGVTFETANKDFVSHLGVRFQFDSVWFDETANLKPANQMGDLQDGCFFRRVRPSWDGTAYDVLEWNVELALEAVSQGIPTLDECWAGLKSLPVLGSVRIGHIKVPQGFEGDMVSSSKAMTFMERSEYTEAFYYNFGSGLWFGNSVCDQHLTYSLMGYRTDSASMPGHASTGADFGDGDYAYSGRVTMLPFFQDDGRHMLHLGVSGSWRNAEKADPGITGPRQVRFRARPEMRDAIGDFGNGVLSGNSRRMVDTGVINADSSTVWGTELFYVINAWSLQAEYAWAFADNAVVGGNPVGELPFGGGYVQASYFLTGENRIYDRRLGRLGSNYITAPYTPFWLVRDENGDCCWGRGAWELAFRYSQLDLNNSYVRGGQSDAYEFGLNWYLNNNFKIQFEYLHQNRYDLPAGQNSGWVDGFGIRTQFFF